MTTKPDRRPVFTMDRDGRDIVLVPLANHDHPAKLLKEDFERITSKGVGTFWTFNAVGQGYAYVRCPNPDRPLSPGRSLLTVARVITGAGRGRRVQYRDGDRLNLRSDNLTTSSGYAKGKALADPC
ncbi:MAG: hypothetical protein FD119_3732 [Stygiobacter sp.]|nr:MAG: hypothetical protein FD119_3732 [Stygiobacter sp.]